MCANHDDWHFPATPAAASPAPFTPDFRLPPMKKDDPACRMQRQWLGWLRRDGRTAAGDWLLTGVIRSARTVG